jgi:hypothetical protein
MIKIYITLFIAFLSISSNAQIKKNSILLGGALYYNNEHSSYDNTVQQKRQSGTIEVSLGTAFKENSITGINLSFSPLKQTNGQTGFDTARSRSNQYNIGAFYREYKKLAKDFYFFGQIDGGVTIGNQTRNFVMSPGKVKDTQRGVFIGLTPGISYRIFKKLQFELTIPNIFQLQHLVTKVKSENELVKNSKYSQTEFHSNLKNNFSLGFLGMGFRFLL